MAPGSFGCCGTAAALLLIEGRRRQAQRYALIGQATEDFDEVTHSQSPTFTRSSRTLVARAQDFVDVEAVEEEAVGSDDDDDDLPQLSPPPVLQPRADPPPIATPVTPAVGDMQARPVRSLHPQHCHSVVPGCPPVYMRRTQPETAGP